MTVTERRAAFVYDAARMQAIAVDAPVIPVPWDNRESAFRKQFLEVIERQCGERRSRSPEELHGSWMQAYIEMGWKYGPNTYERGIRYLNGGEQPGNDWFFRTYAESLLIARR